MLCHSPSFVGWEHVFWVEDKYSICDCLNLQLVSTLLVNDQQPSLLNDFYG